jgi:hypothetical protein
VLGSVDYGPLLSGPEFDKRVTELYLALPDNPSAADAQEVRRAEFDLMIDRRLGLHFPAARREALWEVNIKMSRHPLRLFLAWQVGRILPRLLAVATRRVASKVIDEYRTVLAPEELKFFFGESEIASPGLPLDRHTRREKPR